MDEELLAKLKRIENRFIVVLMAVVPVVQTVIGDLGVTFGVALGGCVELASFYVARRVIEKILDTTRRDKALLVAIVVAVKLAILTAGLLLAFTVLPVNFFAALAGILLILVSVAIEAFWPAGRDA